MGPRVSQECMDQLEGGRRFRRARTNDSATVLIDEDRQVLHRLQISPTQQRLSAVGDQDVLAHAFATLFELLARIHQLSRAIDRAGPIRIGGESHQRRQQNRRVSHCPSPTAARDRTGYLADAFFAATGVASIILSSSSLSMTWDHMG